MVQKSEQQDIDRRGRRLLREVLEPLGWVLTGFEEDYGIDYDVQVFVNGSPDGLWSVSYTHLTLPTILRV